MKTNRVAYRREEVLIESQNLSLSFSFSFSSFSFSFGVLKPVEPRFEIAYGMIDVDRIGDLMKLYTSLVIRGTTSYPQRQQGQNAFFFTL